MKSCQDEHGFAWHDLVQVGESNRYRCPKCGCEFAKAQLAMDIHPLGEYKRTEKPNGVVEFSRRLDPKEEEEFWSAVKRAVAT